MKPAINFFVISLLFSLILSQGVVSAQNFTAIKTDASYYFFDSISQDIMVVRIDSVALAGNETQYFGMRQIRQTDYGCFTPYGDSWLGDVITEKSNGVFQFILYPFSPPDSSDVFTIYSKSALGNTWHFYNYHTINHYIEAKVTQVALAFFIGISDTVKTITLQRKDAYGQNVNDPVNGQHILLSKNYGLIRLPKFDEFHSKLRFMDLCGKTNPITGRTNLSFGEIFDFQPGDEFHIAYDDSPYAFWYPKETGFVIQHIIERINSITTDTVTYKIAECKTTTYTPGMGQLFITNSSDTVTMKYTKSDFPAFPFDPLEPQISNNLGIELTDNEMGLSSTDVLAQSGIPWKLTNATWPLWSDATQQCWQYATIDDFGNSSYYYKGLGGPYHYHLGIITTNFKKLVYYKKGSETWGTPLNCEDLLHVGIGKITPIQSINIFPNPTTGITTLSIPISFQVPGKLEIYDISGRISGEFNVSQPTQTINLGDLPPGLYTYKFISAKDEVIRGKIIRQ
ncbi:MAG: T9SS type A sorting domain-containing protein [Bacteroidota bacterium]